MHQSWRENCNYMFPKRSSEFVVFMSIFLFLFCDWFILLDRVGNPMRDDLDIVGSGQYKTWTADCGLRIADWV